MSEPKHISEILKDYFQNSNEPLAIAYREHLAKSGCCPLCPNSPQSLPFGEVGGASLSDWLDNQDVMQALHISPRTLQTLRSNGILPFSKIGNKLFYRRQDIIKILSDNYTMHKLKDYERNK
jgi:hypothetical protein